MKSTLIILSAFILFGCRTSSRNVTKEKISIDSSFYKKKEIEIKNDSAYFNLSEESTINSLVSLLSNLNVNYNGNADDSAEITLTQTTPNEIKFKIKGKAEADFSTSANSSVSQNAQIKTDSGQIKQNKNENSNIEGQVNVDKSNVNKEMEQKTNGLQWSFAAIIAIGLIVLIVCYFLYRYLKSLNIFSKK